MTLEEKQEIVRVYCKAHDCNGCMFDHQGTWCTTYNIINCPEEELDKAIQQINDSKTVPQNDPVSHPSHYTQGGIECIDAMVAAYGKQAVSYFCLCNAFKYVWRTEHKNGKEDLDKAIWYIKKYKELTDGTDNK